MLPKLHISQPKNIIASILKQELTKNQFDWLEEKLQKIIKEKSTQDLYITYSQIPKQISPYIVPAPLRTSGNETKKFIMDRKPSHAELSRIYLLITVIDADADFFTEKVDKMFETGDTNELATLLRFLILFPNPSSFLQKAVDAVRTNIIAIFDAIALNNPYPAYYFSEPQWNQVFLKAAFMNRPLSQILFVEERSNKELSRIISDFAQERWAAQRSVSPLFWKPISKFMDDKSIKNMEYLLDSSKKEDQYAAALCCYFSDNKHAKELLKNHGDLIQKMKNNSLNWEALSLS